MCQGHDLDLFFSDSHRSIAEAKRLCASCPVREKCLAEALRAEDGSRYGIYGGLTADERTQLVRDTGKRREAGEPVAAAVVIPPPPRTGRNPAPCGTRGAYQRHVRKGEPIDAACREAQRVVTAQQRARREAVKCGTRGGYQKHLRQKTEICGPCRQANTDADNRLRRTGTTKATT